MTNKEAVLKGLAIMSMNFNEAPNTKEKFTQLFTGEDTDQQLLKELNEFIKVVEGIVYDNDGDFLFYNS